MNRIPTLLTAFALAGSLASGLALRHDAEEQAFLDLGERHPAVVQVGGLATGTLVAPQWVLTVAHAPEMIARMRPDDPLTVTIDGEETVVEQVVIPEERAQERGLHDIALLKLAEPVESVQPVSVSVDEVRVDTEVELVGWGILAVGDEGIEMSPSAMASPTRARRAGRNLIESVDEERGLLVARFDAPGGEAGEGATGRPRRAVALEAAPCVGDSGGPALVPVDVKKNEAPRWKVVGVLAHIEDVDEDGVVGEYGEEFGMTYVALYADWILETIKN